jgi:hypothetical protein
MKHLVLAIVVFTLAACGSGSGGGGGDDDDTVSGTAEGLWQGTTNAGRTVTGVVLDDDTYWVFYSIIGNSGVIAGVVQGNGTSSNGSFTSSNGLDFNFEGLGVTTFTLASTYAAKSSWDGTLNYSPSVTTTFTSSYDSDYDLTPSLAAIAGTYSGSSFSPGGPESTGVAITSTGDISGIGVGGCMFSGSVSPRANGNIFDISITFDSGGCVVGISTATGVAYFDVPTKQFTSVGLDSTRTGGFIFIGNKT